jgi:DNA-binding response OmpR family regulator
MSKKKMALVIDDDNMLADLTSMMLMEQGYNTLFCATFEQGLAIFAKSKIDLVVTDIIMPGMGGIEGIMTLKKDFPDCIILAMSGGWSGMSPEDTILAAKKIGADAGLQKPFNALDLKLVLATLEIA